MSEDQACQTPLVELLERVPVDARMTYEHSPTHHQMIPVGRLCHEAAASLRVSAYNPNERLREAHCRLQDFCRDAWGSEERINPSSNKGATMGDLRTVLAALSPFQALRRSLDRIKDQSHDD